MNSAFSYEVTVDDYIDSQITYDRHAPAVRRSVRKSRINMGSFYAFLILILYPALKGALRVGVLCGIAAVAAVHILNVRRLYEARVRKAAMKLLLESNTERILGKKKLKLADDELVYMEKSGSTRLRFGQVTSILESDRNYFIFHDEVLPIILPKSYEGEREQQRLIVERLRAAMSKPSPAGEPEASEP